MSGPRQTRLRLLFSKNETDVSEDLCKDLLSWSFTDHESGQADEISLTLKDNEGKWAGSWKPDGGENVKMYLSAGTTEEPGPEAFLGTFFVDYQRISGAPRVYELRAVSIPLNKPVRKTQKNRAWENHSLQEIAQEICRDAELELFFDSAENPQYQRIDQSRQSDMAFLQHLCEEAGLSIKVTDKTVVIFGQERYEKKDPVCTMEIGVSDILSYTFEASQSDTYKAVKVKWRSPSAKKKGQAAGYDLNLQKTKVAKATEYDFNLQKIDKNGKGSNPAVFEYTYTDPEADENGQVFEMKKRCASLEEAKRLAKAKLRQLNSRKITGDMTVIGTPFLCAGTVIKVVGAGAFSGNYIIEEANHSGGSSGYTTGLRLRRVNKEY